MKRFASLIVSAIMFLTILAPFGGSAKALTIENKHWATKYFTTLEQDGILKADASQWDTEIPALDFATALGKVLGKEITPPGGDFTRGVMLRLAVDNSSYSGELKNFDFPIFCKSNDEESVPKELVPYCNMAFRPKYQLLDYRKGRKIEINQKPFWSEAAYMLYMLKYPPNANPGQQIIVVTSSEPDTLNPFTSNSMSVVLLGTFTGAPDISYDDQANLYPHMLIRVPTLDNGDIVLLKDPVTDKDRMKVTYRIRPGMHYPPLPGEAEGSKFHEITADDYMFAFRVTLCPIVQSTVRSGQLKIDYLKKIDKYTLEVGFNELYTYANWGTPGGDLFKAKFETDFYTDPNNFNVRQDFIDWTVGPYLMKQWEVGDHIEYKPNPYATFAQPLVEKIIVKFMPDPNTIRLNLQADNIDIVTSTFSPLDAEELMKKVPKSKFYFTETTSWDHIQLNQFKDEKGKYDIFGDKRVRQALLYGLDRPQISKAAAAGIYQPSHSWITKKSPYYDESSVKKYEYNPAKAEQLLEEAGWKLANVDGKNIRCKNGDPSKPLKFSLSFAQESDYRLRVAEQVLRMWERIGVWVVPQARPAKELLGGDVLSGHLFESMMLGLVSNPIRPNANLWRSDQIPTKQNNGAGQNYGGWVGSKEHDELCYEIEKIQPETKLRELFKKEVAIWCDELPALPLFNRYDVDVATRDIQNIKPTGANRTINWNCEFWYREVK